MGNKYISVKMPSDYDEQHLRKKIEGYINTKNFTYIIENKSLDARKKSNIYWEMRLLVTSKAIDISVYETKPELIIPHKKRNEKVVVVGSGPAGFFAAFTLQKAGFSTTIIERGADVEKRTLGIEAFEKSGIFNPISNYAFGEGGAGTFSDGKLTSRSKRISLEKKVHTFKLCECWCPQRN